MKNIKIKDIFTTKPKINEFGNDCIEQKKPILNYKQNSASNLNTNQRSQIRNINQNRYQHAQNYPEDEDADHADNHVGRRNFNQTRKRLAEGIFCNGMIFHDSTSDSDPRHDFVLCAGFFYVDDSLIA